MLKHENLVKFVTVVHILTFQDEMGQYSDNDPAAFEEMSWNTYTFYWSFNHRICSITPNSLRIGFNCLMHLKFYECWSFDITLAEKAIEVAHAAANRWTGFSFTRLFSWVQEVANSYGMLYILFLLCANTPQTTFLHCGSGVQTIFLRPRSSLNTCTRR